ncbi:MAG TPA: hypothetical protein VH951_03155, partial [Dehalococcoidia bacterium]
MDALCRKASRRFALWRGTLVLGGFAAMLVAACSGGSSSPSASPTPDFCDSADALKTDVQSLVSAVGSLDRSAISDAGQKVADDVKDVQNARGPISGSNRDQIDSAYNDVKNALSDIGQGGAVIANASAVSSALAGLAKAIADAL